MVIKKNIRGMIVQETYHLKGIPTKIITMNPGIFANFVCLLFNFPIDISEFPQEFKNTDTIPAHKKEEKVTKLITDLSAYYRTSLKITKNKFAINYMIISIRFFYRVNVDFAKVIVLSIVAMLENFKKSVDDGNEFEALLTDLSKVVLTSSVEEKLRGITVDSELKFEKHISSICNKASQKMFCSEFQITCC